MRSIVGDITLCLVAVIAAGCALPFDVSPPMGPGRPAVSASPVATTENTTTRSSLPTPAAKSDAAAPVPPTPTVAAKPAATATSDPAATARSAPTSTPSPVRSAAATKTRTPLPTRTRAAAGTPDPQWERIKGPTNVPASPRFEPPALTVDQALERKVWNLLAEKEQSYGVVVKRLSDGRGVQINGDKEFYAASLYKLLVMYEVFKQRNLKLLDFGERLKVTPRYAEYQLSDLRWPTGSDVTIAELLESMVVVSDNVAAVLLHDKAGGWNIIQDLRAIGLTHTDIDGDRLPTSAVDMAVLLEMIARGKAVDEPTSAEMIALLSRQTARDRLPALLPGGTVVAHKTGNWEDATHDVGIVYAPQGAYVIAVLSDRPWEPKPIAELSRLVYEHFASTR